MSARTSSSAAARAASCAQTCHAGGKLQLAVIPEHSDGPRQLGRRGAQRVQPMQDETAYGGRSRPPGPRSRRRPRARRRRRRGPQQLLQEQRVTAGGRMTRAAELLGRARARDAPVSEPWRRPRSAVAGTARPPPDARRPAPQSVPASVTVASGGRPASSMAIGSPSIRCAR